MAVYNVQCIVVFHLRCIQLKSTYMQSSSVVGTSPQEQLLNQHERGFLSEMMLPAQIHGLFTLYFDAHSRILSTRMQ